ncbi:MAG: class I SAM-dependent methyltransferase [Saprospiraceae bacterium]|nr:class I SAM-dependent methyltransferase [Saprospiraceae bacterium]MCB9325748.1 class I SAM-dependent methyltransferase [Lewinellaceae bacterium]
MQAIQLQQQTEEQFILGTAQYYKGVETINLFTSSLLLNAFQQAGFFNHAGEKIEIAEFRGRILKSERHLRLFFALLDILERHEYLEVDQNILKVTPKATAATTKSQIERLLNVEQHDLTEDPLINDHLWPIASFTREILGNIFEVITEQKVYLEVLFPNNDFSKVERIYRDNVQTYQNLKLAEAVRDKVEKLITLNPGKKIKLLEVGSGTGMGTLKVLEYIKPFGEHLEFWFTDISTGFTRRAKKKFSNDYPFMQFGGLDISKPIADQGFNKEDIDILFCTNVVHATPYIMDVFTNLEYLLKDGGWLFVNDLSKRLDWTTVIFGLTEGWWFFKDPEYRIAHSPILSREKFEEIFEQFGFEQISSTGLDIIDRSDYPQSIISGVLNRKK